MIANALQFIREVTNVINESSKRKSLYASFFGAENVVLNLMSLCPTRWCIKAKAANRMAFTYPQVLDSLKMLAEDVSVRSDVRAKLQGLYKLALRADTYYGILVCVDIFCPIEDLATALQAQSCTCNNALEASANVIKILESRRSDEHVQNIIKECQTKEEALSLKPPNTIRPRKTPKRFLHQQNYIEDTISYECEWKRQHLQGLDLAINEIKRRFDQPGLTKISKWEQVTHFFS